MNNKQFFFCYDKGLSEYLRKKETPFITVAMNPSSKKVFTLFFRDQNLNNLIDEYRGTKKVLD